MESAQNEDTLQEPPQAEVLAVDDTPDGESEAHLPDDDTLQRAMALVDIGDNHGALRLLKEASTEGVDEKTTQARRNLQKKIEVDPVAKIVFVATFILLVAVSALALSHLP